MQIKNKILLTLSITLLLIFCSYICLDLMNESNIKNITAIEKDIHKQTINTITRLHAQNMARIVNDYGCYDEMIEFLKSHDTLWAKSDITIIPSYEMDAVWVFNIKKNVLFTDFSTKVSENTNISNAALNLLFEKKTIHYFVNAPGGIMEICGGSINSSEDSKRLNYAKGYLLIGKLWDDKFIKSLSDQSNSTLKIISSENSFENDFNPESISLPLLSFDGKTIATLVSNKKNLFLINNNSFKIRLYLFFGFIMALILAIFYFSFKKNVIRPLGNVMTSLITEDPTSLLSLSKKTNEFGTIAETILEFFKQKGQLEKDICARKIIESNLRESEKRFRDFAELLPGLVCETTIEGKITFANHAAFEVFGWNTEDLGKLSIFSIFAPEEVRRVKTNILRRIKGEDIGSNEYLAMRKDGTTFPAMVYVNIVFDKNGPVSLRGVMVDLTSLKNTEKEIRKLHHAIEQSPNTIVITNTKGDIEYVNPHFTLLTGFKLEEAIGKNPRILQSGKMSKAFYTDLWTTIQSGQTWKGEFINKKKNGALYWELANISPVKDTNGVIINYIAVKEDITERKTLEQKLLESNEEISAQNDVLKKQKEEIETQRDELSIQRNIATTQRDEISHIHNEIKSSIRYAENIQKAMLPPQVLLESLFEDFFVLYLPKDIVSGDFYWAKHIGSKTIITVADCTGHGVPGAFMSILGISFLNEIVSKEKDLLANEILNSLRKQIVQSLRQIGVRGSSHDGMDMSLVIIDDADHSLQYAGANNSLYIIKAAAAAAVGSEMPLPTATAAIDQPHFPPVELKGDLSAENSTLVELKGDKMPVGIHENMGSFSNKTLQLQKGDILYLMSDGYQDQFGGPSETISGKKFLSKNLKQLLAANCQKSMKDQKEELALKLEEWKTLNGKKHEQTDDITIIGLKI